MLITHPDDIRPSEITPKSLYTERRRFLKLAGVGAAGLALGNTGTLFAASASLPGPLGKSALSTTEEMTPLKDIARYNNYYEFGTNKEDPRENAQRLPTRPWTVTVDGLAGKPRTFDIDDILKIAPLEERIYRLRCVEAWSMVVPWVGFPLAALLKQVDPLGSAKFVEFSTFYDPDVMIRVPVLDWPYKEGLRLDEAMHPLTIMAVGLYGEELPKQNGAPIRLVVPWKYGFKSAKSIVHIHLTDTQPNTAWNDSAPAEYGFYSNVNPDVNHPRWSQAKERRIGDFLKRPTLPFNGYGDQVAALYAGMDLRKFF